MFSSSRCKTVLCCIATRRKTCSALVTSKHSIEEKNIYTLASKAQWNHCLSYLSQSHKQFYRFLFSRNENRDYFFFSQKNIDYNLIVITGCENIQTILHRFVDTKRFFFSRRLSTLPHAIYAKTTCVIGLERFLFSDRIFLIFLSEKFELKIIYLEYLC